MPRETNLEIKVGAFVIAAVVTLVAFIFSISDFSVFQKGQVYKIIFQYANGLKKGAPVRLAGVDVGHIRTIQVSFDEVERRNLVRAEAWIADGIFIPEDSEVMINQLGIMGEKYLEIMPGISDKVAPVGMVFRGEDSIPMESIMKTVSGIATKFEGMLDGLNSGILSEENKKSFAQTLANLASITGALRNGEGTVGKFLTDQSVFENLEEFTADLKANPWKLFYRPKGKK